MNTSPISLSLADVARLAHVQRPVVSMWRRRTKEGSPFPAPLPDGRFPAEAVVNWLEETGRGKNPDPRAELSVYATTSAGADAGQLRTLQVLLTARVLLDAPLAAMHFEDLLDSVDGIDPDDQFLFREVEAIGAEHFPTLAAKADSLADAAWHPRNAYEHLEDALVRQTRPGVEHPHRDRLSDHLLRIQRSLGEHTTSAGGEVVDVDGACTDAVIALLDDEDVPDPGVLVTGTEPDRSVLRRYRIHGLTPRCATPEEDWELPDHCTILTRLTDAPSEAFDVLDSIEWQLPRGGRMLVIGTAEALIDRLPVTLVASRDRYLRENLLRAAVRLPQGQTADGSQTRLALWLLTRPADEASGLRVADLAGRNFGNTSAQALLDDLIAACSPARARVRSFSALVTVDRTQVIARSSSLLDAIGMVATRGQETAADDAARLIELRTALNTPPPEVLPPATPTMREATPHWAALGQVIDSREAALVPGARLEDTPGGTTPLWNPAAVTAGEPRTVDLVRVVGLHPHVQLTEPDDVVFTLRPQPAATVDRDGGAVVAYPARVLRVRSHRLAPAAIATAINSAPSGNAAWRSWRVPVVQMDRGQADEILARLDSYETDLRLRGAQLAELRSIVDRSVLSGAIELDTRTGLDHEPPTSVGGAPHQKGRP